MKLVRMTAIATLIFLGVTALIGSVPLILDPSGAMLKMPLSLLEHSPFSSFLVPGIILMVANSLLSFFVLVLVLRRTRQYGWWLAGQGCVIGGWISIQVMMIRTVVWAHLVYWAIALILIVCGWLLRKDSASAQA